MNSSRLVDQFDFGLPRSLQVTGQKGALLFGAAFVILVALLLSESRGGILSTALWSFRFGSPHIKGSANSGTVEQRGAIILLGRASGGGQLFCIWRSRYRQDHAARLTR